MLDVVDLMKTLEEKCLLIRLFYCCKRICAAVSPSTLSVYDYVGDFVASENGMERILIDVSIKVDNFSA